jgi:hypothetical protein
MKGRWELGTFEIPGASEAEAVGKYILECERGDLNPHGLPHWILSPARLPGSATLAD